MDVFIPKPIAEEKVIYDDYNHIDEHTYHITITELNRGLEFKRPYQYKYKRTKILSKNICCESKNELIVRNLTVNSEHIETLYTLNELFKTEALLHNSINNI